MPATSAAAATKVLSDVVEAMANSIGAAVASVLAAQVSQARVEVLLVA